MNASMFEVKVRDSAFCHCVYGESRKGAAGADQNPMHLSHFVLRSRTAVCADFCYYSGSVYNLHEKYFRRVASEYQGNGGTIIHI
jgi:hypothetical protein